MEPDESSGLSPLFFRFLLSKAISTIIFELFTVYFIWIVVVRFQSVFLAGMIATIYLIVQLVSSIPIGHAIDRFNNTTMSFASSIIMLAGLSILLTGFSILMIYTVTAIISLGNTIKGDSFAAIIKKHVHKDFIGKATSVNQGVVSASDLIGILMGGIAILFLTAYLPYILILLCAVSLISAIPAGEQKNKPESAGERMGYSNVFAFYRKIIGFILFGFVINGLFVSLSVYSSGIFHIFLKTTPAFYTAFIAAIPLGMIIGSYVAGTQMKRIDRPAIIAFFIVMYAPLILIIGLSHSPVLDVAASFLMGLINPVINVPISARLVRITPHEIFGRIFAFLRIFIGGSTPVMAAVFSFLALFYTVNNVLVAVGFFVFPFSLLGFVVLKAFFKLESTSALSKEEGA